MSRGFGMKKCQRAFASLKESLTTHPTLHLYQEGLPFQVYCDTTTFGIAGVLKQVHPDGKTYPVQYFSHTLRSHERNYSTSELECLAIVESVDKFRVYLMDRKFTIFSEHHALQWLKTIKNPSGNGGVIFLKGNSPKNGSTKKKQWRHPGRSPIDYGSKRGPCRICLNRGHAGRFHPENRCWFREKAVQASPASSFISVPSRSMDTLTQTAAPSSECRPAPPQHS
ncbi:K02A2.6-like [Cordylochernes scorpioides]|uniref:K02A2.6-like n=1 Tax=Cordylochernes scorpioides TaxID=51811 RepID=A0ABY6LKA6_9ARAC|nr:K02A2.6-like [Cordylochernes scorpioides]